MSDLNVELTNIDSVLKEWTILKHKIRKNGADCRFYIFNNYIYNAHLGINIGSEQEEDRPVLVIRTTKESPICTIIPLTLERINDKIPYHVDLSNGISTALVEQIRTISKTRIYERKFIKGAHATIDEVDLKSINEQIQKLFTLKPLFKK